MMSSAINHLMFTQYDYCLPCSHLRITAVDQLIFIVAVRGILDKFMQGKFCSSALLLS